MTRYKINQMHTVLSIAKYHTQQLLNTNNQEQVEAHLVDLNMSYDKLFSILSVEKNKSKKVASKAG